MSSQEIAEALLNIKAVGFVLSQPITFKSGIKSPVYVDNRKLPYFPEEWQKVIQGFSAVITEHTLDFDVIAGIETAGIPHSAALAYVLKKPSVFVRKKVKDHGTKSKIEGGDVSNKKVLLLEDHVTTGGSSLAGVESLRESGAIVTTCLSITSYEFAEGKNAFKDAGVELLTLTTFADLLKVARTQNSISEKEQQVIAEWLKDPWQWTANKQA